LNVFTKYCPEKHSKFSARDRSAITKHLSTRGRGFPPTSKSEILQFAQFSSVSLMTKNWSIRFANFGPRNTKTILLCNHLKNIMP
jgi:hypothetical protein